MLVLTRGTGEKIWVDVPGGEPVCFTINDVRGDRVRVGVEAPKHYGIHRDALPTPAAATPGVPASQGTS